MVELIVNGFDVSVTFSKIRRSRPPLAWRTSKLSYRFGRSSDRITFDWRCRCPPYVDRTRSCFICEEIGHVVIESAVLPCAAKSSPESLSLVVWDVSLISLELLSDWMSNRMFLWSRGNLSGSQVDTIIILDRTRDSRKGVRQILPQRKWEKNLSLWELFPSWIRVKQISLNRMTFVPICLKTVSDSCGNCAFRAWLGDLALTWKNRLSPSRQLAD